MKKLLIYFCVVFIVSMIIVALPVNASDITNAKWMAAINATNNGTATSNVSGIFTLNSASMAAQGLSNSSLTDIAILYNGADARFMPGHSSNPWALFINEIGVSQTLQCYLYSKDVTGGLIRWFPSVNGGYVTDNANLELSDSGNITQSDFMNTNVLTGNYTYHYDPTLGGIVVTNNESGRVQADFYNYYCLSFDGGDYASKAAGVVSPSGGQMSFEGWVYFDNVAGVQTIFANGYTGAAFNFHALFINGAILQFRLGNAAAAGMAADWSSTNSTVLGHWYHIMATYDKDAATRVKVYVDGVTWGGVDVGTGGDIFQPNINLFIGAISAGLNKLVGDLDDIRVSDVARAQEIAIDAYNAGRGKHFVYDADTVSLWHLDEGTGNPVDAAGNNDLTLGAAAAQPTWVGSSPCTYPAASVSLVVASGEHIRSVSYDSGTFTLIIDSSSNSTTMLGSYIPDVATNWYFGTGNITPYIEYIEVCVGAAQRGFWDWEYAATFSDQSGNGNTMIPSFRTTSSDADVSAFVASFQPIEIAQASAPLITYGQFLTDLTAPSQMYLEGNYSFIPGADAFNVFLDASNTPRALWWFPFIFIGIGILGMMVFGATKTQGGEGSLLTQCIVCDILLFFFAIMGPTMLWPGILFWVPATALILSRKHTSYG